jgi:hypothetical protein
MRVIFVRVADFERGLSVVTRDDGVTYRLADGPVTGALPHDLIHFAVEDELAIADGIWGAIAGGVVFTSMTHVSGRRPPHAAERSTALIREHRDGLHRAELIGGFVDRVALGGVDVRTMPEYFASLLGSGFDPEDVRRAVARVRTETRRWADCPVGEELVYEWPAHRRVRMTPPRNARAERAARAAQGRRSRAVRAARMR